METIFREAAKALGQIAAQKLMIDTFKEEEIVKPKKVAAVKKEAAGGAGEARWTRWTKTYTDAFKKALSDSNVNADEKEFDKLKKEFVKYLNDLTEEDYHKDTKTHPDRMKDFANLKAPKKEDKKEEKPVEKKTMWEEMTHETPNDPPCSPAMINAVDDIEDMRTNEFLITVKGSPEGVFWDGKNGRWIRGPPAVEDEDLVEKKFKGETYDVGEQSGRIYQTVNNRDVLLGYVGVGKFRDMKMP